MHDLQTLNRLNNERAEELLARNDRLIWAVENLLNCSELNMEDLENHTIKAIAAMRNEIERNRN